MDTYYNAPKTEFNDWFEIRATENMIPDDDEIEMKTDLGIYCVILPVYYCANQSTPPSLFLRIQ